MRKIAFQELEIRLCNSLGKHNLLSLTQRRLRNSPIRAYKQFKGNRQLLNQTGLKRDPKAETGVRQIQVRNRSFFKMAK